MCSAAVVINSGCNTSSDSNNDSLPQSQTSSSVSEQTPTSPEISKPPITPASISDKESAVPQKWDTSISFTDSEITIDGKGAHTSGTTAVITKAGTYRISGECNNGAILVNADGDDNVILLLDGITLSNKSGCVIRCENADLLTLSLAEGSENIISDADSYSDAEDDSPDSAIFCRDDLVINGSGKLIINANYKDAVKSKDGLKIAGGDITISSVDDGIIGRDFLIIGGGSIRISSAGDSIKATNDTDDKMGYISITDGVIDITSEGDAIHSVTELFVSGGNINAVTGGGSATVQHISDGGFGRGNGGRDGRNDIFDFDDIADDNVSSESKKGLKSDGGITVSDGTITLDCADDTLHAAGTLLINGGSLELSSGDDGIHSDVAMIINNGDISISKSYEALEALTIDINGGKISAVASDDGINVAGGDNGAVMGFGDDTSTYYISITGGEVTLNAAGDGIDSNGTVALSRGSLIVYGPENGANGALDYQNSFAVSGGTLVALGARQMATAPSTLSQPCISIYSNVSANTKLEIVDKNGKAVISVTTPKSCDSLIFSSDKMTVGESYSITANGTVIAEITAGDGVSGDGANGSGFGGWEDFGNMGGGHHGRNDADYDGNRPEKPDGMPMKPEDFDFSKMPEGIIPPDIPESTTAS